jgi:hypothetical protein
MAQPSPTGISQIVPLGPGQTMILNEEVAKKMNREAFKRYYDSNQAVVAARVQAYRADDPEGEKAKKRRLTSLRYNYKKKPTAQRALTIYAAERNIEVEDITTTVHQVVQEVNASLGITAIPVSLFSGPGAVSSTAPPGPVPIVIAPLAESDVPVTVIPGQSASTV